MNKLDRVVNRFILAFVIFTLVVSSAIMTLADFPDKFISPFGIPYLSVIGFSFSVFLGLVLLFAVLRSRKM